MTHIDKIVVFVIGVGAIVAFVKAFAVADELAKKFNELGQRISSLKGNYEYDESVQFHVNQDYGKRLNDNKAEIASLRNYVYDAVRNGMNEHKELNHNLDLLFAVVNALGLQAQDFDDEIAALFEAFDGVKQDRNEMGMDPIEMKEIIPAAVRDIQSLEGRLKDLQLRVNLALSHIANAEPKRGKK